MLIQAPNPPRRLVPSNPKPKRGAFHLAKSDAPPVDRAEHGPYLRVYSELPPCALPNAGRGGKFRGGTLTVWIGLARLPTQGRRGSESRSASAVMCGIDSRYAQRSGSCKRQAGASHPRKDAARERGAEAATVISRRSAMPQSRGTRLLTSVASSSPACSPRHAPRACGRPAVPRRPESI